VGTGTDVIDSCATKCASFAGSFVYLHSEADVEWKGISVSDCGSACGALCYNCARATVSGSNFTNLEGKWGSDAWAAAIDQDVRGSSMNASLVLIAGCSEGKGCFANSWGGGGGAAAFPQCSCWSNTVGAIAQRWTSVQDVLVFCYFVGTNLTGSTFNSGSVLVDRCLFAGAVPTMPERFTQTGAQISYTSTGISFDTASLLPACGGIGGLPSQVVKKSPAGTRPYASLRLMVKMVFFIFLFVKEVVFSRFVKMVVFFLFLALPL
jgi:hypothetical protein